MFKRDCLVGRIFYGYRAAVNVNNRVGIFLVSVFQFNAACQADLIAFLVVVDYIGTGSINRADRSTFRRVSYLFLVVVFIDESICAVSAVQIIVAFAAIER